MSKTITSHLRQSNSHKYENKAITFIKSNEHKLGLHTNFQVLHRAPMITKCFMGIYDSFPKLGIQVHEVH